MAFVLSTWLGQKFVLQNKTCLQVYAKLGGKHLGQVELRSANKTLVEQVKDLQEQVAKLLAHPTRTSNYLALELQGFKLPSFTYRNAINMSKTKKELLLALSSAKPNSRLECMYDEDDMYVFQQVKQTHGVFINARDYKPAKVVLNVEKKFMPEVAVLKYVCNPVRLVLRSKRVYKSKVDLSFLSGFTDLQVLGLETDIHVKDWNFAKRMVLKEVLVHARNVSNMDFSCLQHLEDLWIDVGYYGYFETLALTKLPKATKRVHILGFLGEFTTLEKLQDFLKGVDVIEEDTDAQDIGMNIWKYQWKHGYHGRYHDV
jgi:hypothetical protein